MSNEQKNRVLQAIKETERQLEKELSYNEKHQNKSRISEYKTHIAKLEGMIK